jgi:uncharacterized protein (DUF488 family)
MPLTLYTIGHSDHAPDEFIAHLKQHGIAVLVDVRSVPFSRRFPHFSKNDLRALLRENHIRYSYAGDKLGGRPQDEALYHEVPDDDARADEYLKRVDYEAVMQQPAYRESVARLLEIVGDEAQQGANVAVLCSEGNPRECHRHYLIAKSLITESASLRATDQTVQVQHILRDGSLEKPLDASIEFKTQPRQQPLL